MKPIITFTLFLISSSLLAQDSLFNKINQISNQLYSKPVNYLQGSAILNENKDAFSTNPSLESFYHQISGTFQATAGRQLEAKRSYWLSKKLHLDSSEMIKSSFSDYREIFKQTASQKVVMINENHAFPEHRVFTTSLLPTLYEQGFRYLALEDLLDRDFTINDRAIAHTSDGFYMNEIMFAELVRKARSLGFTLVAYDNNDEFDYKRDSLGAVELKKVFDKNPDAKMLIHCGFGHIQESGKVLGTFIKSMLEIDPLTISQTSAVPLTGNESSEPKIISGDLTTDLFNIKADIQIIHPVYNYDSRPEYLFANGRKRVHYTINLNFSEPILLETYLNKASEKVVPLDRITLSPGQESVDLSVPEGEIEILFKNEKNEVIERVKLDR